MKASFFRNLFFSFKKLGILRDYFNIIIFTFLDTLLELLGFGLFYIVISRVLDIKIENLNYYLVRDLNAIQLIYCFVIFFILRTIFSFLVNYYLVYVESDVSHRLRIKLYKNFIYRSLEKIDFMSSANIIASINLDISNFVKFNFMGTARAIRSVILVIAILFYMIYVNLYNLIIFLILIFIFLLISLPYFKKKTQIISIQDRSRKINIIQYTGNLINVYKEIKSFFAEDIFIKKVANSSRLVKDITLKTFIISDAVKYYLEIIFFLVFALIIFILLKFIVNFNEVILIVSGLAFLYVRISPYIRESVSSYFRLSLGQEYLNNFKKNISIESIEYKKDSLRNFSFASFEMANLNYSLDEKKRDYIFKDLSFNFKKGDKIYIQGQSGIGKTILLEIVSCLRTIDKEIIQINKKNDFYKEFAYKTALLSHNISILDGSIAQNVAFGDDNINHYKVKKVLEKVELKEFLRDDFYNNFILRTDIENISEGQKKRLALARAFYYDKEIFLLDELTSNLDSETEKEIVNLLVSNKEITIIATSHTPRSFDKHFNIYEIRNKKIIKI